MSSDALLLTLYLASVTALACGVVFFIFWRRMRGEGELSRSLGASLLRVSLPRAATPEGGFTLEQLRERIAIMEKVYANLHGMRASGWRALAGRAPSFALELTVPHVGEEIAFYVALPRHVVASTEKIIEAAFPDARVEPTHDYNIFNPDGESSAAAIVFKRDPIVPVRTYRELESDSLRELTNAFSKLAHVGEGACLQIVARPAPKAWNGKITGHARQAFLGQAPIVPTSGIVGEGVKVLGQVLFEPPQKPEAKEKEPEHRLSPQEETLVRRIEAKGSRPLFEVNVRIVASAPTKTRADEIVQGIAAGFLQFRDPALNEFALASLSGKKLDAALYRFSFRIFNEQSALILSSEELTSLYHFPNVPLETPKLGIVKSREAAPPVNLPAAGLLLGVSVFRGETKEVRITDDDRRRHLYVIGQTGTGKSAFLVNLIRQDILAGKGVCFIDPHGETVEQILGYIPKERVEEVIYFNPGDTERPMGLNLLEYDERFPEQKTFVVNELFSIFQKLYGAVPEAMGPMFEQYFRNATLLVLDDPRSGSTLLEVGRIFADPAFRGLKLSRSTNVVVKSFWRDIAEKAGGESALQNIAPYITSKFDTFLANEIMRPIIAQERSAFNFRQTMQEGKILLVNLSKGRLGELNSALIGLIVVGKILMAALSRTDIPEEARRDCYLYIDEFQNVTTRSIATILSEARKYGLSLTIAHQFLGQLEEEIKKAVFGNAGSMVAFRIGSDDAEFVSTQFKPVFAAQDLLNIDNYNAYVKLLIRGQTTVPFNVRTLPPSPRNPAIVDAIKLYSRLTYGRPRAIVEAEVNRRYEEKTPATLSA